jgi:hypothetical protein
MEFWTMAASKPEATHLVNLKYPPRNFPWMIAKGASPSCKDHLAISTRDVAAYPTPVFRGRAYGHPDAIKCLDDLSAGP